MFKMILDRMYDQKEFAEAFEICVKEQKLSFWKN
jgi:hypothetical protein